MDSPEILKGTGKFEMKPIFYPDMIRTFDEGKAQLHKGGGTRESHEMVWSKLSPQMMPMPGTPDFCEFLMDGAM
jgi:hypothetical protein